MPLLLSALLLLSPAVSARAADDSYAALKPLLGTWLVDRDCRVLKDRVLVVVKRLPKTVLVEFRDPKKPASSWGKADIVTAGEEDHYRVFTAMPDHPLTKALGVKSIQGSMGVSDDEDEPDGPGKDYITVSSRVSALSSMLTIKLRDNYKKATFLFKAESPLGGQTCRGVGVKQPAAKKAAP